MNVISIHAVVGMAATALRLPFKLRMEQKLVQWALSFISRIHNAQPVTNIPRGVDAHQIYERFYDVDFKKRRDEEDVEKQLEAAFLSSCGNPQNGGHFAYVPGGGLAECGVAALLTNSINRNLIALATAPALAAIEMSLIHFLIEKVGFSIANAGGYTTNGGALSLFGGVSLGLRYASRSSAGGAWAVHKEKLLIYIGAVTHSCVRKAIRMCGLSDDNIRVVKSKSIQEGLRMDVASLREQIEGDMKHGMGKPALVVATLGSTCTGHVDNLSEISKICEEFDIWLHCDGAYGGGFVINDDIRNSAFRGLEKIDSLTIDAHKSLFVSFGMSFLLVKEKKFLLEAFGNLEEHYIDYEEDDFMDFSNLSPENTRQFLGLRLWLPLRLRGCEYFSELQSLRLKWTRDIAIAIESNKMQNNRYRLALVTPPVLTALTFTVLRNNDTVQKSDVIEMLNQETSALNRKLVCEVNSLNRVYLACERLPGVENSNVVRICVLSSSTSEDDIKTLLEDVQIALNTI